MEQYEQITVNDIRAIKDYENITEQEANNILHSVKQMAVVLYEYQRKGKYEYKNPTAANFVQRRNYFNKQVTA